MNVRPDLSATEPTTVDNADITVVGGAGHVGIPLVLALAAAGSRVNVNDLNKETLAVLKSGRLPYIEYDAADLLTQALAGKRLVFTDHPSQISRRGPVIVTIGTPVDEFLNPVRRVVQGCIDSLLPHMADGQLLILRSTVFPGTTDWVHHYLKEQGRDIRVAFCPERVVQGYGIKELREMPQIVSGTTPEAEREARALFESISPEAVVVSPMEAEFAKLFNNAYRYIEFAATNEFYLIARSAGLDYQRILNAMKHNYPRARNIPRPGYAAGPCLVKDTMQLAAYARNQFGLGHAAMLINEGLVLHVLDDLQKRYDLSAMTVGLLGMAFKAEVDDTRASLSYKFKNALRSQARRVLTTDPFVTTDPDLRSLEDVIAQSDLMILCTPHLRYKDADFAGKPVVDVWGFLQGPNIVR
ncbi:MAG: nucleotide sugar dehydrogenase [Pseudorhodoplanes sp.]|nr:UDP-N-acetyl-D-glucosamine 6-dehydrogenase [Pseudorhodoplanes sp.]MCL4710272.1 nucleotide sugar dehydrogenase [Pseudorhodoplanes sp.]GIK79406.1 MAG: UDP-N-acetyl-D-mannosaminuronic acid dehydrogenase [Alphaproteobacteria bacterium]